MSEQRPVDKVLLQNYVAVGGKSIPLNRQSLKAFTLSSRTRLIWTLRAPDSVTGAGGRFRAERRQTGARTSAARLRSRPAMAPASLVPAGPTEGIWSGAGLSVPTSRCLESPPPEF